MSNMVTFYLMPILTLIIMEGLLSVDNALVLAMKVRVLPEPLQKKALFLGLWGAYIFRIIAILLGTWLVHFKIIQVAGAAYLLYMVWSNYFGKDKDEDAVPDWMEKGWIGRFINQFTLFVKVVCVVELMDITFSVDSVIAAFGVSQIWWVLWVGGILGILMMRGISQFFVALINKVPELEHTAFVLIGLIGIKMLIGVFGIEIPQLWFFVLLVVTFAITFVVHAVRGKKPENNIAA